MVNTVEEREFEKEIAGSLPVLVDFYADWCGPCKSFLPILEEAASEYEGRCKFIKINVDDSPTLSKKMGIRGIPNLILFKEGEIIHQAVGSITKEAFKKILDENLSDA